jgi:hypothetical protein
LDSTNCCGADASTRSLRSLHWIGANAKTRSQTGHRCHKQYTWGASTQPAGVLRQHDFQQGCQHPAGTSELDDLGYNSPASRGASTLSGRGSARPAPIAMLAGVLTPMSHNVSQRSVPTPLLAVYRRTWQIANVGMPAPLLTGQVATLAHISMPTPLLTPLLNI